MTVASPPDQYDIFLSHAHLDAAVVDSLGRRLEDEARFAVWLDRWVLVPGEHWQQEMAKGLDRAKTCAVCVGGTTPAGWFREEIRRALNRQTKDETFRVIPVILPGGDASLLDEFLELRTCVDFKDGIQDGYAFHLLSCGVKGIAPGRYDAKLGTVSPQMAPIREALTNIRALRDEQLIDRDIAAEYQRRILDKLVAR